MNLTTLFLTLFTTAALGQCPSIFTTGNHTYLQGYPEQCDFFAGGGYSLDCLGCRHRHPVMYRMNSEGGVWQINVTSNIHIAWAVWLGNPCEGGELIASAECGGWEYWCGDNMTFRVGIELPVGEIYYWAGGYSDCQTCQSGQMNVAFSWTNNPCVWPSPLPECETFTAQLGYGEGDTCGDCEAPEIMPLPCGNMAQFTYASLDFTVTWDVPTPVTMVSAMNYTFNPSQQIFAHAIIMQGDDVVWTTIGGACAVDVYGSTGTFPSQNWEAFVNLPQGDYTILFGHIGTEYIQLYMDGCASVTVGFPILLHEDEEQPRLGSWSGGEYRPRYTKVVIEGRGVFIRDGWTGEVYDLITRKIQD